MIRCASRAIAALASPPASPKNSRATPKAASPERRSLLRCHFARNPDDGRGSASAARARTGVSRYYFGRPWRRARERVRRARCRGACRGAWACVHVRAEVIVARAHPPRRAPPQFEWPRHTADFTLLRAYVAPDGSAAEPAAENVPYCPGKFLRASPSGAAEGDFAFLLGFPGSTMRYAPESRLAYSDEARVRLGMYTWGCTLGDVHLGMCT